MFSVLISPIPDTNIQPQDLPARATLTLFLPIMFTTIFTTQSCIFMTKILYTQDPNINLL